MKLVILLSSVAGILGAKIKYEKVDLGVDCLPGYVKNSSTGVCSDIDECAMKTHNCGGSNPCRNTAGSFQCMCSTGYSGSLPLCVNIDECKTGVHTCKNLPGGIMCKDTVGSFECACKPGWENLTHSNNVPSCVMANECTNGVANCHENATCHDTPGSFVCACKAGYTGNGTTCVDVDECTTQRCSHLRGAVCNNTVGSFKCDCKTGWNGTDGNCSNVNECTSNTHDCANSTADCIDNDGSFFCRCKPGYVGNGLNCTDENECTTRPVACKNGPLLAVECNNTDGSFECKCKAGWNQTAVDEQCTNVNECDANATSCDNSTSNCVDTQGSFTCVCKTGYRFNASTSTCDDIDECANGNRQTCTGEGQACKNLNGTWQCGCADGFDNQTNATDNTVNCTNKDECSGSHTCHASATCTDGYGSYSCACNAGFIGDGVTCNGYDVCMLKKDNCSKDATCSSNATAGTFTCTCKTGFHGNGTHCYDADECHNVSSANASHGGNDCNGTHAKCTNIHGSFLCSCNAGYSGDGKTCENVDECSMRIDNCWVNSNCTDTEGSFECACLAGYNNTFNNISCVDIDECMVNWANRSNNGSNNGTAEKICHDNATCVNTVGSYACSCKKGFAQNGTGTDFDCADLNECAVGLHDCHAHSYCSNTHGSFLCRCKPGYSGNGTNCTDIDECTTAPWYNITMNHTACDATAICKNVVGSFTCKCRDGYSGDGKVCSNVDECALGTHDCFEKLNCTDTTGSFVCKCPLGFTDLNTLGKPDKKLANGTQCMSSKKVEVGMIQIKKIGWQTVEFRSAFSSTPVVVLTTPVAGDREVYPRIKQVTTTSFKVALSFPKSGNLTLDRGYSNFLASNLPVVSYMAAVPGKSSMPDGTTVIAGRATAAGRMQRSTSCKPDSQFGQAFWTEVKFAKYNSTPAVFAQIDGMANPAFTGGSLGADFCTSGIMWDESKKLNDTIKVSRVCAGKAGSIFNSDEKLGWITVGFNISNFTNEKNAQVWFETVIGDRNLTGSNASETIGFATNMTAAISSSPVVVANKVSVNPKVFGYMQMEGATTANASFKIVEDQCDLPPRGRVEYVNMFVASTGFSV
eukprot:TRINITY_DN297_c0_g1_i2.p1 TRINITY_DN297_c0_g1~~TRINITY_DN297_c0_g1_i2.p1  ORF type:complete len:1091 (-),score=202.59 TRINITY_DN297_c0_g1_i2:180-3452(-)